MTLKLVEIGMLVLSPKGTPAEWTGEDQKIAHRLVKRGLMSNDPTDPAYFECTDQGEAQIKALTSRGRDAEKQLEALTSRGRDA